MRVIDYNAATGVTTVTEVADEPVVEPVAPDVPQPSIDERLASVETTQEAIIDMLAESLGVAL